MKITIPTKQILIVLFIVLVLYGVPSLIFSCVDEQLGEFIGGITAPLISLISIVFIYQAFTQQSAANRMQTLRDQSQEVRYLMQELEKLQASKEWSKTEKNMKDFIELKGDIDTTAKFNSQIWLQLRSRLQVFSLILTAIKNIEDKKTKVPYLILLKHNFGDALVTQPTKLLEALDKRKVILPEATNLIKEVSGRFNRAKHRAGI